MLMIGAVKCAGGGGWTMVIGNLHQLANISFFHLLIFISDNLTACDY